VTLFVTPDWRETVPRPTARILSRIPVVRHRVFLTRLLAKGTMRLDRHPDFVRYLASLPRTDVGIHGLHHVHRGPRVPVELQNEDAGTCRRVVAEAVEIFRAAGLSWVPGFTPPGWTAPPGLLEALISLGFRFLASARDITSAVSRDAVARMSGLTGVSLLYPELLMNGRLVHITTNFQATCQVDRALELLDCNGLLAIKAHIAKDAGGHVAADGLDELYRNYLDVLFRVLERRDGDALWWTSMDEVARAVLGFAAAPA
jgi:predicted deacetylase